MSFISASQLLGAITPSTTDALQNEIVHFHGTGPEVFVHVESHEMRDIERRRNSGARTYTSGSASDEKSPSTLQVRDQLQSTWEDDSDVQHGVGRINSSSEDGTGIV